MNGCDCGGCRDCLRAQGYDEDGEAVETVAANLLDEYLASAHWIGEASCSLTDEEYRAIDVAHAERDAMKLFAVRDAAVRRVLTKWAEEAARDDFEKLMREIEDEAAADAYDRRR